MSRQGAHPLQIHPSQLRNQPLVLRESLPASLLELHEPLAEAAQPVEVDLKVDADGSNVLVTGSARTVLRLQCARCCRWLEYPLVLESCEILLPDAMLHPHQPVDIFPPLREELLLQAPAYPVCPPGTPDCRLPEGKGEGSVHGTAVWKALDQIRPKP